MNETPHCEAGEERKRELSWRHLRWLAVAALTVLGGVVVVTLVVVLVINWRGDRAVAALVVELERKGLPASLEEAEREAGLDPTDVVRTDHPYRKAGQVASWLVTRMEETEGPFPVLGIEEPEINRPIDPAIRANVTRFIDKHALALHMIREVTDHVGPGLDAIEWPRLPADPDPTRWFELPLLRFPTELGEWTGSLGYCLVVSAVAQEARGDADAALADIARLVRLARSADRRRSIGWIHRRTGTLFWAQSTLVTILRRTRPTDAALAPLEEMLRHEMDALSAEPVLRWEIARHTNAARSIDLTMTLTNAEENRIGVGFNGGFDLAPAWIDRQPTSSDRWWYWMRRITSAICPGWYERVAVDRAREVLDVYEEERDPPRRFLDLRRHLLGSCARLGLAVTAISLKRHRLRHGMWPAGLADLATAPPENPITGGPFGYDRLADGVRVWTPGMDNRGAVRDPTKHVDSIRLFTDLPPE